MGAPNPLTQFPCHDKNNLLGSCTFLQYFCKTNVSVSEVVLTVLALATLGNVTMDV